MHPCPCCEKMTLDTVGEYEICEVCKWEDDPFQSAFPDQGHGANGVSLVVARKKWRASIGGGSVNDEG